MDWLKDTLKDLSIWLLLLPLSIWLETSVQNSSVLPRCCDFDFGCCSFTNLWPESAKTFSLSSGNQEGVRNTSARPIDRLVSCVISDRKLFIKQNLAICRPLWLMISSRDRTASELIIPLSINSADNAPTRLVPALSPLTNNISRTYGFSSGVTR